MAFDLQFVQPRQLISVTQVLRLTDEVVRIIGSDFRSVDHVLLNGFKAPGIFLESPTSLQARLPDGVTPTTLGSVDVFSRDLSLTETSRLSFGLTSLPSRATGVLRLVQSFLRILLSTPGTDIFDPSLGGGALRNLGQNFSSEQNGSLVSDVVVAVDRTRKQIVNIQARNARLPPDEMLLDAKVTSTSFDPRAGALYVTLLLTAQSGRLAFANLALLAPDSSHGPQRLRAVPSRADACVLREHRRGRRLPLRHAGGAAHPAPRRHRSLLHRRRLLRARPTRPAVP